MGKMQRCTFADVHEATEVITESFNLDPIWVYCFPNEVLRTVGLYCLFAPQIIFLHMRSTRVLKDEAGKIVSAVIFEDEKLNPLLQVVGFILQSVAMYVFMLRKIRIVLCKSKNPLFIVTCPLWVPCLLYTAPSPRDRG